MFGDRNDLDSLLHRRKPTKWQLFIAAPAVFLARKIYSWRSVPEVRRRGYQKASEPVAVLAPVLPITIVCISDTHNTQSLLPNGDILVHAGDLTQSGSRKELQETLDWLRMQPHRYKIVIAGNHDILLDTALAETRPETEQAASQLALLEWGDITYLQDSSTTLKLNGRELKIYGSPWSPRHGNWAFQYPRSKDIWQHSVPTDTDILLTHGPPKAHLDLNYGCNYLLNELWRMKQKPLLHVFGHVHEGYGQETVAFDGLQAAYEDVLKANGGFFRLWRVLIEYFKARFWAREQYTREQTVMVNAAQVGGLRDELKREPVVILI